MHEPGHLSRIARGAFVKHMMEHDGRSARFMASRIGISHTAFGDRLRGKAPFLADELEEIAYVFKMDPIEFYRDYIAAGTKNGPHTHEAREGQSEPPIGLEPITCGLQGDWLAPVTPIFGRVA